MINVLPWILVSCDTKSDLNVKVNFTYISWFSDYALYLEDYLIEKCPTLDISSLQH